MAVLAPPRDPLRKNLFADLGQAGRAVQDYPVVVVFEVPQQLPQPFSRISLNQLHVELAQRKVGSQKIKLSVAGGHSQSMGIGVTRKDLVRLAARIRPI